MQRNFGPSFVHPLQQSPAEDGGETLASSPEAMAASVQETACRLVFPSAALAGQPCGGVALVARVVRAACDEGHETILLCIEDGQPLATSAIDDLGRACPAARILYEDAGGASFPRPAWAVPDLKAIVRATAKPGDGLVSRYINRPLSQAITLWLLVHAPGVRPMHVTIVVGMLGLLMVALMLTGSWAGFVVGALLFQLCSLLDGVDGELARATWRCSRAGARADTLTDQAINLGFFAGLAMNAGDFYGDAAEQAALAVALLVPAGVAIMLLLAWLRHDMGSMNFLKTFYRRKFPTGIAGRITDGVIFITSRDFFALTSALAIVFGFGVVVPFALLTFALLWVMLILLAFAPVLHQARITTLASEG